MSAGCGIAEQYTMLEVALPAVLVERCPVCGGTPALWNYVNKRQAAQKVVMCDQLGPIGPELDEELLADTGCPLSMPPRGFYRPTKHEAVTYWNAWAVALLQLRDSRP